MPATHHREFLQKLRVLLIFIEFNILIFIMICTERRTHLNPGPPPVLHPAPQSQPQSDPRRRRKPQNPWVVPWILQRQEKGCYNNLLTDLIHTDIPGYHNFVRMQPAFFYLFFGKGWRRSSEPEQGHRQEAYCHEEANEIRQ